MTCDSMVDQDYHSPPWKRTLQVWVQFLRSDWVDPLDILAARRVLDERLRGIVEVPPLFTSMALLERIIPLVWGWRWLSVLVRSLNVSKSATQCKSRGVLFSIAMKETKSVLQGGSSLKGGNICLLLSATALKTREGITIFYNRQQQRNCHTEKNRKQVAVKCYQCTCHIYVYNSRVGL